jgi:hypothetical protein
MVIGFAAEAPMAFSFVNPYWYAAEIQTATTNLTFYS